MMNTNKLLSEFILGINYWESQHATQMWKYYDKEAVEEDMKV